MVSQLASAYLILPLAAALLGQAQSPPANTPDDKDFYTQCVKLSENSPESAERVAGDWRDRGGGFPARHCLALALAGEGKYREAAETLETMAEDFRVAEGGQAGQALSTFDRSMIADIYGQAGNAWLLAGEPIRAYDILTAGISEATASSQAALELLIDRARASAATEDFDAALVDLDAAQAIEPDRADIYVFRANAHRVLEHWDEAKADIDRALEIDPRHLGALLERGNLKRIEGDDDGARQDWLAILSADPESPVADAARKNIESMDVKTDDDGS